MTELVKDLGNANLTVRLKATNQLALRGGKDAVAAVLGVMNRKDKPEADDTWRRMHGLYVLERLGALDDATLIAATKDKEFGVRVHAQRILAERRQVDRGAERLGVGRTEGSRPERATGRRRRGRPASVRRPSPAVAGTGIRGPRGRYSSRLCRPHGVTQSAVGRQCMEGDSPERLDRARRPRHRGCIAWRPTPESATFLLKHLGQYQEPWGILVKAVHHIARYGNPETAKALIPFTRGHHADDLGLQNDLFKAVGEGVQERGAKLDEADRQWAGELTDKLLASKQPGEVKSGAELVGALKLENEEKKVADIAINTAAPRDEREAALGRCRRSTRDATPPY